MSVRHKKMQDLEARVSPVVTSESAWAFLDTCHRRYCSSASAHLERWTQSIVNYTLLKTRLDVGDDAHDRLFPPDGRGTLMFSLGRRLHW